MNERTHQHCASANQTRSGHDDVPLEDGAEKSARTFLLLLLTTVASKKSPRKGGKVVNLIFLYRV